MSPTHLLQTIWAVLVLWYVIERLMLLKGRIPHLPAWHNPVRAARDAWRALWDEAPVAWAFLACVFGAHAVACAGRCVWSWAVSGWPQALSDPSLRALVDVRPAEFLDALRSGEYWACRWRELLDAAVAYPAFQPAMQPAAVVLLLGVLWWAQRRGLAPGPDHPRPRARAILALRLLGVGLAAALVRALVGSRQFEVAPSVAHWAELSLGLIAVPVISGATVGLLALLAVKIVLALPVRAEGLIGEWLDRLPRFVALCALPGVAAALADWFLADWQLAPHPDAPGLAAALWVFTRLAWLLVLPGVLRVALHAGPARVALAEFPRLVKADPRAACTLMLRSAAALFPVLALLGLLEVLAPASGLIPGAACVLTRWSLAFVVLAGAAALYREMPAAPAREG